MEDAPDSFFNKKLDLSACEEKGETKKQISMANEMIEAICDLDDPAFNNISIKQAFVNFPFSIDVDLHSESIGHGLKLAFKAGLLKSVAGKAAHIFEKELAEIYHD